MTIDWHIVAIIAAPIITLFIGAALERTIRERARVVAYLGEVSVFTIRNEDNPPFNVHTHSVVVRNAGRRPAHNVRLGHQYLPPNVRIFPEIEHMRNAADEIVFPTLVPGEQVTVGYLYHPPVVWTQINGQIKSDDGMAKILNVLPTPQLPTWIIRSVWFLMSVGVITLVYLAYFAVAAIFAT